MFCFKSLEIVNDLKIIFINERVLMNSCVHVV